MKFLLRLLFCLTVVLWWNTVMLLSFGLIVLILRGIRLWAWAWSTPLRTDDMSEEYWWKMFSKEFFLPAFPWSKHKER